MRFEPTASTRQFSKNPKSIAPLICEKMPCLSQKMMINHKMSMSGVYENVFQISENYS